MPEGVGAGVDRRLGGRVAVGGIDCDAGRLVDCSVRGMRLSTRRRWVVGRARVVRLGRGSEQVAVAARCVWARRVSLWNWSVGIAFENLDEATRDALDRLVRSHAREDGLAVREAA